jgi:hypothetical protein
VAQFGQRILDVDQRQIGDGAVRSAGGWEKEEGLYAQYHLPMDCGTFVRPEATKNITHCFGLPLSCLKTGIKSELDGSTTIATTGGLTVNHHIPAFLTSLSVIERIFY